MKEEEEEDLDLEEALSRMKRHAENTKASFAEMLMVRYPEEEV